jgi:hypothetical protein
MSFGGQNIPDSFKNYISYEIGDNSVFLHPALAKKAKIVKESEKDKNDISSVTFPFASDSLSISFDPGPSGDPTFVITFKGKEEYLGGEKLYVSSSGSLYLVRKSNEYFEKKLKFRFSGGKLKEVYQPFYLVDQKCKTSTPLSMYDGKCNKGNLIARLPKGANVYILLMEKSDRTGCPSNVVPDNEINDPVNNYLVSTPFGLVGWVASSGGYVERPGKPLGCLRFFGD